jgi:ATP-binding cassette, subfamily B (MDR/TAP), member 1
MNNVVGADLPAGTRELEEKIEEGQLRDAELKGMSEIAAAEAEKEIGHTTSSSQSISDDDDHLRKLDSKIVKIRDIPQGDAAFDHLPEHERAILKRQLDIPEVKVSFKTLFRYASTWDIIIFYVAAISSIAAGAALPLMTVIFGNLSGVFQGILLGTISRAEYADTLVRYVLYFIYLAIAEFVTTYIGTVGSIYVGEHVTAKLREEYLKAILRQNIAFFDKLGAGEVTTRITADTNLVQDAISEKISLTLYGIATFITAFVIGFVKSWKLTIICASSVVAITATMGIGSTFMVRWGKKSLESYAIGGSVVEEVLGSIRNATAFGTQDKLALQYNKHLLEARRWGWRVKGILGVMVGFMFLFIYWNYGLAFWEGSRLLVSGEASLASILTIILAIIIGAFSLGNVAPNGQAFTSGLSAAAKIYNTIDRISPLDPTSAAGKILDTVEGSVELKTVKHIYPSRAEVVVMSNVNLLIPAGKTTALVGASGSGKSTIVGLVERFYDPVGGGVYLDGHNIETLNLRWLRQQISLVQQEPVLFGTTIRENIRHGLIGSRFENEQKEQQEERIISAAKQANAHDFISNLPEGYETHVGERGFLLSGGQKQRIAIARAIVSDPKILLLDEATSALDTKSEGVVQAALDAAAQGRTTIVIAHRLSTIKTADNIVVMSEGQIIEQGTHDDLLERKGAYHSLVNAQQIGDQTQRSAEEEEKAAMTEAELTKTVTARSRQASTAPEDEKLALGRTNTSKSISSQVLEKKSSGKGPQYSLFVLIKFIASFNRKEWYLMALGLCFSIISGGGQPTQGIFFAKAIVALSQPLTRSDEIRSQVNFWALMYLMLGLVNLLAMVILGLSFAFCSERLIHRARDRAFRTMLRQDISFFDKEENTTGALTAFLSTEATHLGSISGATLGTILTCTTTLVGACAISLAIGWKLALVCISTIPVLLGCGFFRFYILAKFQGRSKKAYESSASYACENTNAIRTVASLTREDDVYQHYHAQLVIQGRRSLISVLKSSSLYASSQSCMLLCTALGFWYGGTLIGKGEYNLFQFFICFSEIIFGAQSAGTIFSFAGDMSKARNAANELRRLVDLKPSIDNWSTDGQQVDTVDGTIEFRDVHFRYPSRPEVPVLRGLNLTVKPGQYVALVGASGCGKSTTIQLMERFYDPLAGGVFVDGKEISGLNLNQYRSFLALVSQEPTLYQGTIKENILLGADRSDVPDEHIIQACKDANIYTFIMSLP